jgi:hypothetical protein
VREALAHFFPFRPGSSFSGLLLLFQACFFFFRPASSFSGLLLLFQASFFLFGSVFP